jgi:hypothetical protein
MARPEDVAVFADSLLGGPLLIEAARQPPTGRGREGAAGIGRTEGLCITGIAS